MSLLMDALRRAEATANKSPANDAPANVAPQPGPPREGGSALSLEPVDSQLAELEIEASNSDFIAPAGTVTEAAADAVREAHADGLLESRAETAMGVPAQTPAEPLAIEPAGNAAVSQQQAQAAVAVLTQRRAAVPKAVIYVFTGLLTVALLLTAYYWWENSQRVAPQGASAATLIDTAPLAIAGNDSGGPANEVVAVENEPARAANAPAPAARNATPPNATTPFDQPDVTQAVAVATPQPAAEPDPIEIHASRQTRQVPPALEQAYRDYRRQAYTQAEQGYREVLRRYPANRDAMLGLAAIALHQSNRQLARHYYERLLQADPADKTVKLALQALTSGQSSLESGSRIKYWLQSDPDNPQLHFALGNQYAASGQWKEAQQAYFEAHRLAPGNADYAFNLAVSLDQLRLPQQALDYYNQARTLARSGNALFSLPQLERRIAQLQPQPEQTP